MVEGTIVVKNKTGLHARPASQLVKLCKTFESDIILKNGDISCNGKSMFSVLKGCFTEGTSVCVTADGSDEAQALEKVIAYINDLDE